jgi:hypothetical protein
MSRGNVEAECKTLWCPTTPLTPLPSAASCSVWLSRLSCWLAKNLLVWWRALAATRALPFNTSLNPTAYSATLMREASALQWFAAAG